jgi:hypothetical protein
MPWSVYLLHFFQLVDLHAFSLSICFWVLCIPFESLLPSSTASHIPAYLTSSITYYTVVSLEILQGAVPTPRPRRSLCAKLRSDVMSMRRECWRAERDQRMTGHQHLTVVFNVGRKTACTTYNTRENTEKSRLNRE